MITIVVFISFTLFVLEFLSKQKKYPSPNITF